MNQTNQRFSADKKLPSDHHCHSISSTEKTRFLTNIINFRTPKSHTSWVEGAITETTTTPNNQVETDRQNCIVALLVPYNGQFVCSPCSLLTLPKVLTRRIYLAITSFLRQ